MEKKEKIMVYMDVSEHSKLKDIQYKYELKSISAAIRFVLQNTKV
jgi:hypothetical protein